MFDVYFCLTINMCYEIMCVSVHVESSRVPAAMKRVPEAQSVFVSVLDV